MASALVTEVNSANWEAEVVNSPIPVLVDFFAPWCVPCRHLAPTIDKLAEQFAGKIKVCKLNTDENQDIAVRYRISSIPAVLIFKGSDQPAERVVGNRPEAEFVKVLNRVLEG
jgi:thioredoxin 1